MVTRLWSAPAVAPGDLAPDRLDALFDVLKAMGRGHRRLALAFSLQAEDLVLLDAARRSGVAVTPIVLDTLRLHAETIDYLHALEGQFRFKALVTTPDADAVAQFERDPGRDSFYDSLENRKACCRIRKVEPLAKALAGFDAWITGQRRAQSLTRSELAEREDDPAHGIVKYNPLAAWSAGDVFAYAQRFGLPLHPLYQRGFPSIGCEPCTRPIRAEEDERAGRWWWEQADSKECGLHVVEPA